MTKSRFKPGPPPVKLMVTLGLALTALSQLPAGPAGAGEIRVCVIDRQGESVADAAVRLYAELPERGFIGRWLTAGDGSATLDSVSPGSYRVEVSKHGFTPFERLGLELDGGETIRLEQIELRSGHPLRVSTSGPDGMPLPGVQIVALPVDAPALRTPVSAVSGERGNASLADLAPGRYRLLGLSPGLAPALAGEVEVPASFPVPMRFERGGSLELVARDRQGQPLAFRRLQLATVDGHDLTDWYSGPDWGPAGAPITDDRGQAVFPAVRSGVYDVGLVGDDPGRARRVEVRQGRRTRLVLGPRP